MSGSVRECKARLAAWPVGTSMKLPLSSPVTIFLFLGSGSRTARTNSGTTPTCWCLRRTGHLGSLPPSHRPAFVRPAHRPHRGWGGVRGEQMRHPHPPRHPVRDSSDPCFPWWLHSALRSPATNFYPCQPVARPVTLYCLRPQAIRGSPGGGPPIFGSAAVPATRAYGGGPPPGTHVGPSCLLFRIPTASLHQDPYARIPSA